MTANYKSINAVNNMLAANELQDHAVLVYINIDKQKGIDSFSDNNSVFIQWFDVEKNNVTEPGESNLVSHIQKDYSEYLKSFLKSSIQLMKQHLLIGYYQFVYVVKVWLYLG